MSVDKVKILSAAIKIYTTDAFYSTAVWQRPAQYRQIATIPASVPAYIAAYTTYDGKFFYIGFDARVIWLIEPTLTVARTDAVILPAAYDQEAIDWVVRQMQITNYMPEGGV